MMQCTKAAGKRGRPQHNLVPERPNVLQMHLRLAQATDRHDLPCLHILSQYYTHAARCAGPAALRQLHEAPARPNLAP